MSGINFRDSEKRSINFNFKEFDGRVSSGSVTLDDFCLNAQGNKERSDGKDLFGKPEQINAAAKKIYSQMNPDYYKPHVSLIDRFILWILNLTSSDSLAEKVSRITSAYLDNKKEINIAFLKKEQEEESTFSFILPEIKPTLPSSLPRQRREAAESKTQTKDNSWSNPLSFKHLLLDAAIKSQLRREFPNKYPKGKKIKEEEIEEFKETMPLDLLKQEIDKKFPNKPSCEAAESKPKKINYMIDIWDNPDKIEISLLFTKLSEKLNVDQELSREYLAKYLKENPAVAEELIKEVESEMRKMKKESF